MEDKSFFEKIEAIKMPVRIAIAAGTAIVLIVIFIWFIYLPKSELIDRKTSSIDGLKAELNRAKIQRKKLPEKKEEKRKVDLQFAEALKYLPNNNEIPELLTKITELGTDSNLDMSAFRPKKIRKRGFYAEVPISLKITGSYPDVAVFFEKVGKMDRIMNIQNVSMKPVKPLSTTLNVTCDAITYTFLKGK